MKKQIIPFLGFVIYLCSITSFQVSANINATINTPDLFAKLSYVDSNTFFAPNMISTKRGEKYDESKDPALRKGTENWEQTQGNFWIIPAIVVGLIFAVLFFNRN